MMLYFMHYTNHLYTMPDTEIDLMSPKFTELLDSYIKSSGDTYLDMPLKKARKQALERLREKVPLYHLHRWLKLISYMLFHLITIVVILLLGILTRAVTSVVYIFICVYLILTNHDYFSNKWKFREVITYFLLPFVLVDLTIQTIY